MAAPIPFQQPKPDDAPAKNDTGLPKPPTGEHAPIDDTERGGVMDWFDELGS